MRNISKISTLEQKFPLLAIENGCIISKDADITVAFEMELPELFTITSDEYEAMHSTWYKSIKVLPNYTIVHKQDWFIMERYESELQKEDISFLGRAYEKHFNERPFLNHSVYLFITKTNKQKMMQQSNFSTLCRGNILPKEITDKEGVNAFLESVDQFERIMNSSGFFTLKRLDADEIAGTMRSRDSWTDTFHFQKATMLLWKIYVWELMKCVSVTRFFVCILYLIRTTFRLM